MPADQLPLAGTGQRRRRGSTEAAAERTLTGWRDAGHHPDPLTSSQLRGAARDVDQALDDYAHDRSGLFTVTRARGLLAQLHAAAAPPRQPTGSDPLADILDRLATEDE